MLNLPQKTQFCQTDVSGSTFVNADCFDVFPFIEYQSVDCVIADLPYGTTDCKWDSILPLDLLFTQYRRITKKNGAIILTASQPFTSVLISHWMHNFKVEWIWQKNAGSNFGTCKYQPMKEHESVIVFSNGGGKITYNPIMQERAESGKSRVKTKIKGSSNGKAAVYENGGLFPIEFMANELRYPSSIQKFNRERGLHPTQKPVELMEYLIKTYTNEKEIVLDNTMGSGTTGLACLKTNRQFIGIEKEKQYYDVAVRRALEYCH